LATFLRPVTCFDLLRRVVALLCFASVLGLRSAGAASETDGAVPVVPQRRAVVVGSSSVRGAFGRLIAADLERHGYRVTRKGLVSAGLARPDFVDMREVVKAMPIDGTTAAVFVYLGVNDGQALWLKPGDRLRPGRRWLPWSDRRWSSVYRRRAQRLYEAICRRGARRAIVLLPVEVVNPRLERKLKRIRALQREAAQHTACATAVATAGNRRQFFVSGQPTRLRDGFHMTELGARLAWDRVKQRAWLSAAYPGYWAQ
jgi:hypothetical protein